MSVSIKPVDLVSKNWFEFEFFFFDPDLNREHHISVDTLSITLKIIECNFLNLLPNRTIIFKIFSPFSETSHKYYVCLLNDLCLLSLCNVVDELTWLNLHFAEEKLCQPPCVRIVQLFDILCVLPCRLICKVEEEFLMILLEFSAEEDVNLLLNCLLKVFQIVIGIVENIFDESFQCVNLVKFKLSLAVPVVRLILVK